MKKTEYKMIINKLKTCTDRERVFSQITRLIPKLCAEEEITDAESERLLLDVVSIQNAWGTTREEQARIDRAVGTYFLSILGEGWE